MKYALIMALVLTGCSTAVPVSRSFPGIPDKLMEKCPPLKTLKEDVRLSDVAETTVSNYTTYYECSVKNDGWIEWYQEQKRIFESVK
jgi:hypothetical protein